MCFILIVYSIECGWDEFFFLTFWRIIVVSEWFVWMVIRDEVRVKFSNISLVNYREWDCNIRINGSSKWEVYLVCCFRYFMFGGWFKIEVVFFRVSLVVI